MQGQETKSIKLLVYPVKDIGKAVLSFFNYYYCVAYYNDIAATHKIMKRDVGIAYLAMRKIHYNVMRFRDTLSVDEAEVLAGRFKSVSARHYVLHDPEKLTCKYVTAWMNFGVSVADVICTRDF